MCTRYLMAPHEYFLLSDDEILHDEKGQLFLIDDKIAAWKKSLADNFKIDEWKSNPRLNTNLAPTNKGLVVYLENGKRVADNYRFGFKRQWMQGGRKKFNPGTNFRFDNLLPNKEEFTSHGLPVNKSSRGNFMYYEAFKNRQFCLIPIRGFIEFDKEKREVELKTKTVVKDVSVPYLTELKSGEILAAAGLWENSDDELRFTFGTTDPNDLVRLFHHDRFPVFLLSNEEQQLWLNPDTSIEVRMGAWIETCGLFTFSQL
jgi:putative SOS response-associated peptidase YedK